MVDVVKMCPQFQHKHRTGVVMKPHLVSLCPPPPGLIQVWPPLMCNEVTLKVLKYQGQFQGNESPNKCHSSIICFTKVTSVKCSLSYAALLMD